MSKKTAKDKMVPPISERRDPVIKRVLLKHEALNKPPGEGEDAEWGDAIVGRRVKVYWPDWKNWYWGVIQAFKADAGTYEVLYDDGDRRWEPWDYNFRVLSPDSDPGLAEAEDVIMQFLPADWPDHVVYTSSLIWADDPDLEEKYREYSTLAECSEIRLAGCGRWGLFAVLDLPDTCLLDEYTGYVSEYQPGDEYHPLKVGLHSGQDSCLYVDASQRGNETRFIRRLPRSRARETNAKFSHIILDGELKVFIELTRDVSTGEEIVAVEPEYRLLPGAVRQQLGDEDTGANEDGQEVTPQARLPTSTDSSSSNSSSSSSHTSAAAASGQPRRDDAVNPAFLQHLRYEHTRFLLYDRLPDEHPFLRGRRCLFDFVYVTKVSRKGHPCFGQYGAFASVLLREGHYIGQYTGRVGECDGSSESMYVAKFVNTYDEQTTENVRIDGEEFGNEMRFINDYRNTGLQPNVQFILAWLGGTLQLMVVAIEDIPAHTELLIDYGDEYWDVLKEWEDWEKKMKNGEIPEGEVYGVPADAIRGDGEDKDGEDDEVEKTEQEKEDQ